MKQLTEEQYKLLTEQYADALTLAKHSMVANGVEPLIPIYEYITGQPMNKNCADCRLDMMICLYIAVDKYKPKKLKDGKKDKTTDAD